MNDNTNHNNFSQFKDNNQNITIENRKNLKLTGIKKIEALNPNEFILDSILGGLVIKGNNLEMKSFDVDKGNMIITGDFDSLAYFSTQTKKNKSFIQKLFK